MDRVCMRGRSAEERAQLRMSRGAGEGMHEKMGNGAVLVFIVMDSKCGWRERGGGKESRFGGTKRGTGEGVTFESIWRD
jgi:hypothetical protein